MVDLRAFSWYENWRHGNDPATGDSIGSRAVIHSSIPYDKASFGFEVIL